MKKPNDILSIGYIAERTGLSVSAIRFYEEKGLITPHRNAGGHRRYMRSDIRRLSFVMVAQQMGFSIDQIRSYMKRLPEGRTPTAKDWKAISSEFRDVLEQRIQSLSRLRDRLDGCIGCGCLSLDKCQLYNSDDKVGLTGAGPRLILGESEG
ncbi:redox-sensitive transcriptional activator SoxR [Ponticaulis profundi]|uniref:Redox-sensitive transcriptional activator SoxR n=1 Tax=Ponticaulis profundi TaxID=2665222 RepID=A0ABW1S7G2_9PROT